MNSEIISVPDISCQHCLRTIQRELSALEGVSRVSGDVERREITVYWEAPADLDAVHDTLAEIGYPPAG
ncbi:MAG: heavy-metal-associated domain-containing protein [Acidobacteria bacterium]|nr:heavy-metal-associated domain-containing protein [Acidobacteriota bacterium]